MRLALQQRVPLRASLPPEDEQPLERLPWLAIQPQGVPEQLRGAALLPEDVRAPFDNDFIAQETSKVLVEAAETLSAGVAARLVADVARRSSVTGCGSAR